VCDPERFGARHDFALERADPHQLQPDIGALPEDSGKSLQQNLWAF